ncbi:ASCH domain-containing protein [Capnocytophaga gingivalis]|jgi:hypothetical protein
MNLHLTLKKNWFDLILSGEKKEEYREIKPYWEKRLIGKKYDRIIFRNGYRKNAPQFTMKLKSITQGTGKSEWGAEEGKIYFVLSLGEIINTKNIDKSDANYK